MRIKKIKTGWHFKMESAHIKSFNSYGPTKTACLMGAIASLRLEMDKLSEKINSLKKEKADLDESVNSFLWDDRKD